jgi:hypothetical protein
MLLAGNEQLQAQLRKQAAGSAMLEGCRHGYARRLLSNVVTERVFLTKWIVQKQRRSVTQRAHNVGLSVDHNRLSSVLTINISLFPTSTSFLRLLRLVEVAVITRNSGISVFMKESQCIKNKQKN